MSADGLKAPFSPEQVRYLNAYQASGAFHPFTCPRPHKNRTLIAQVTGWVCPSCDYTQDWAHKFMADPRWERRLGSMEQ